MILPLCTTVTLTAVLTFPPFSFPSWSFYLQFLLSFVLPLPPLSFSTSLLPSLPHPLYLSSLPPSSSLLLSQSRESIQGPNIVYTGKGNLSRVAQFIEWNGQRNISGWGTPTAQMINGTGGFMFHPGVTRDENLTAFISELFR